MTISEIQVGLDYLTREYEKKYPDVLFRPMVDAVERVIQMQASTKTTGPIELFEYNEKVVPADWCSSWWARLIRWLATHSFFAKYLPLPLQCLAAASKLTCYPETFKINHGALSEIASQKIRLQCNNLEPGCILMGKHRFMKLHDELLMNDPAMVRPIPMSYGTRPEIMGLPCFVLPFVDSETIIVAPKS